MKKDVTLQDIQESIVSLKVTMEQRFGGVDGRLDGIDGHLNGIDGRLDGIDGRLDDMHEAMNLHSEETDRQFRELRATTATKDYVDDRIGQLRGEFHQALKRTDGRGAQV